ncbi:MAG: S9 family peptidase [Acidimicrobiales bacterium]
MTVVPFGSWPSVIPAELLVREAVGLSAVDIDEGVVIWSEARPGEGGRVAVVAHGKGDLIDAPYSARTLAHEYGGRCAVRCDGVLIFSNLADQRLWRRQPDGRLMALTPTTAGDRTVRFADPVMSLDRRWVICVRESHGPAGVVNELVCVAADGDAEIRVLATGHDFFSAPRVDPAGERIAWLSWDHPDMPWDATELWVASFGSEGILGEPQLVAGGRDPHSGVGESVTQPKWSPGGVLHYLSDRSGWWNLYDEIGTPLAHLDADFGDPDWAFGQSSYAFLDDGTPVVVWWEGIGQRLGVVAGGSVVPLELGYTSYASLVGIGQEVVAIAASPVDAPAVVRIDISAATVEILRVAQAALVPPDDLSIPELVHFPSADGRTAHALFYPPRRAGSSGPPSERPPLVVLSHGGPTSSARPFLNLAVQYWTNRGVAVVDVDYGGSSRYGREYRDRLRGQWGIVDVEDCVHAATWLADQDRVDPHRMAIAGGSAGGFTTLCAVTFHDVFAAGACRYGVADLDLLARDTHKFESRYLDGLVGPLPAAASEYRRRSPIHAADRINCPMIVSQGLEDAIVPPAQSEIVVDALRAGGVPVAYLEFEGEQHGFRRAETIVRVAEAELSFFGRALGFVPAGSLPEIHISNEEALPSIDPPISPV